MPHIPSPVVALMFCFLPLFVATERPVSQSPGLRPSAYAGFHGVREECGMKEERNDQTVAGTT